jgi:hypothetical protein
VKTCIANLPLAAWLLSPRSLARAGRAALIAVALAAGGLSGGDSDPGVASTAEPVVGQLQIKELYLRPVTFSAGHECPALPAV